MASQPIPNASEEQKRFFAFLKDDYTLVIPAAPGRWVGIQRLMFHWTMHEGQIGDYFGHDRRFCYRTFDMAVEALDEWISRAFDGEPEGWHRDPYTGRRRPDGDKSQEYVEG